MNCPVTPARSHRQPVALAAPALLLMAALCLLGSAPKAMAGSLVDWLSYEYPCNSQGRSVPVIRGTHRGSEAVIVRRDFEGRASILINESALYKINDEVVIFEYFSACHQVKMFDVSPEGARNIDPSDFILNADCRALFEIRKLGLFNPKSTYLLFEYYAYEGWGGGNLGVTNDDRAKNIQSCY